MPCTRLGQHTDQTQPDHIRESKYGNNGKPNPQRWGGVHAQPEESFVRRVHSTSIWVGAFEHPLRFAIGRVDLIPPTQTNQSAAGDVLEVVEVDREEDESEDKDEYTSSCQDPMWTPPGVVTNKFLMKRTPNRYMSRLPGRRQSRLASKYEIGRAVCSPTLKPR